MTDVLKLGGSVITEKDRERTVADRRLESITAALGDADLEDYVLVLGGGSFGHPAADRHGITRTVGSSDPQAVAEVHDAMLELTSLVIDRLVWAGIPAVAVHPSSLAARVDSELTLSMDPIEAAIAEGFVPVMHGDFVVTLGAGVTILSGDEIVAELAGHLEADRVGLCTGVSGVLDGEDEIIDRIERYGDVAEVLGESADTDVTGGMAAKVSTLLDVGVPASIFGMEGLEVFLAGGHPGTTLDPGGV